MICYKILSFLVSGRIALKLYTLCELGGGEYKGYVSKAEQTRKKNLGPKSDY